jgi:flagellar M-ring protein FliF
MPAKLPNFINTLVLSFKSLNSSKKITLILVVGLTVAALSSLLYLSGRPDLQVLYSNLAPEDAGAILLKLKEQKIPYQVGADGRSILVPSEKLYEMRMQLATEGLPQGAGVGFEIFDNTKLGMTEFVQNVNYQRALQGELSRTIGGMAEVESCRTHIVIPPKSLFLDKEEEARASVVLKLRPGRQLDNNQIRGIVHFVSSSIPRLKPENVTIVDSSGKMLAGQKEGEAAETVRTEQIEYQEKMERSMEGRIKTMLAGVLGPDKAIVRVSCLLDFRREEKTAESYLPDAIAKRSEQISQSEGEGAGGVPTGTPVGVTGLPLTGAEGPAKGAAAVKATESPKQEQRIINYEVSKVVSRVVEPVGSIKRVSVAVVVDGQYKKSGEGKDAKWEYVPRSKEEMAHVANLVKRVVNFDEGRGDKVEVVNLPFEARAGFDEQGAETKQGWLSRVEGYVQYGKRALPILGIALLYFLMIRPIMRWLLSGPVVDIEMAKRLPMTVKEIEEGYVVPGAEDIGARGGIAAPGRVMEVISQDKENSIRLMKAWVGETGEQVSS